MHTTVDKNGDLVYPKEDCKGKKYFAKIPDVRINHFSFECCGYHLAWADTIEELVSDIRSFKVPKYSEDNFLYTLMDKDDSDKRDDRQVELYWDGSGTLINRGKFTTMNMTEYTSF